jgi:hypothetical protein
VNLMLSLLLIAQGIIQQNVLQHLPPKGTIPPRAEYGCTIHGHSTTVSHYNKEAKQLETVDASQYQLILWVKDVPNGRVIWQYDVTPHYDDDIVAFRDCRDWRAAAIKQAKK